MAFFELERTDYSRYGSIYHRSDSITAGAEQDRDLSACSGKAAHRWIAPNRQPLAIKDNQGFGAAVPAACNMTGTLSGALIGTRFGPY